MAPHQAEGAGSLGAHGIASGEHASLTRGRGHASVRNGVPPASVGLHPQPTSPVQGLTVDRITNPTPVSAHLVPPFQQVRVQTRDPVPGQVYNVVFISVYNRTRRTFTADDNMTVRITDQGPAHAYPLLTGDQQWKPRQTIVVYFFTKKYYPLSPQVSAGFTFNFAQPRFVAIPGPSGFYQKITYNPSTFHKVLDAIVVDGPNPFSGSRGHYLGLPDTAIWEVVPAGHADLL